MSGDLTGQSLEYYVLKDGEMLGPFDEDQLRAGLANGQFAATDFFQPSHETKWQPMRSLLAPDHQGAEGAVAPDWHCILKWAWLRLRYSLGQSSVQAGGVCLAIGTAVLILSRWPFLFWIPWFIATAIAAVALIRRKREAHGTVLLLCVICVPMAYFIFGSRRESRASKVEVKTVVMPATQVAANQSAPSGMPGPESSPAKAAPPPAAPLAEASPTPEEPPISGIPVGVSAETPAPREIKPSYVHATPESTSPPITQYPVAASSTPTTQEKPAWWQFWATSAASSTNASASTPAPDVSQDLPVESLVIVKGSNGAGSGFICRANNRTWLFTNIHVAAEIKDPAITRLDNQAVTAGNGEVAAGPDLARFVLTQPPQHSLELLTDLENNVKIGDDVVVLGNSGGGGVVTRLNGKVLGIGPDRLEVSAEFIPGNSGSPIIHVKSGKVIGIATYLTRRSDNFASGSGGMVIRRFGYRLDKIPAWEPINWPLLYGDADQIKRIEALTNDIVKFLLASRNGTEPAIATETLRRPFDEWQNKIHSRGLNPNDRISATQSFLNTLRTMVRTDVAAAEAQARYTYYRNKLKDEKRDRDVLFKVLDSEYASSLDRNGFR